jgi:hypothetical protein
VATVAFYYSEQFQFERPFHKQCPKDTMVFFQHEMADFVKSQDHVVVVAIGPYNPEELAQTEAVVSNNDGWQPGPAGEDAIVGFGVWKLPPDSTRNVEFQDDTGSEEPPSPST